MRTWIIHRRGINLFINLPILGKFPRNIVYTQSLSNSKPQSSHHIIGTKELSNLTRVIQGYISSSAYSYRLQAPQKNQPRRKTMRYTLTIRQKWLSQNRNENENDLNLWLKASWEVSKFRANLRNCWANLRPRKSLQ